MDRRHHLAQIGLVVFDMDGVLADTSACHRRAFSDLWHLIGMTGPDYDAIAGRRTADVIIERTEYMSPSTEQVREWIAFKQTQARRYLGSGDCLFSDVAPCLRMLVDYGLEIALGTGASSETADLVLRDIDPVSGFGVRVTADDVRQGKPSPEVYLTAMERAGYGPCETMIVEDSPSGLASATASGAYVACVRTGRSLDCSTFIGSFPDLYSLANVIRMARS